MVYEKLIDLERKTAPFKFKMTNLGFIPDTKTPEFKAKVLIDSESLNSLPKYDYYALSINENGILKVECSDETGGFQREIKPKRVFEAANISVKLTDDIMNCIANLKGEVILHVANEAIMLCEKSKDHAVTYVLSVIMEQGQGG